MNTKTLIVHCTYSEDGRDVADILLESFRIFLQKELNTVATPTQDGV